MILLPLFVTVFFTSLMDDGQPVDMPIAVVDNDNTSTTRKLTRLIDAFQNTEVVAHYPSVDEARKAIQRNEIYGFVLFPEGMTQKLLSGRQPKISLYYSFTTLVSGALIYKEMKTMSVLASSAVGLATLQARGLTQKQAMTFLQPISIDNHMIGNPLLNYNSYLSAMIVPGLFILFVFLMTAYSLGTEIKFGTKEEWLRLADGNIWKALLGKILPHTAIYIVVLFSCLVYMYGLLHFPMAGGLLRLLFLGILTVIAAQGFALFLFGLIPSLRMSMSICSLWGILSLSMVGSAYPVFAMDAPLQTLAWLFPLRHYYMIYQLCVFNDFPLVDALPHILAMLAFALVPVFVVKRMEKAFNEFGYQP